MEQPREHAVQCRKCRRMTWNNNAICDSHDATIYLSKKKESQ